MKVIIGILFLIGTQSAYADISVSQARNVACELAMRLGWQIQASCAKDFGQPFKVTHASYVFRNRVLGPNCEARIIVPKNGDSPTGYVQGCE